MAGGAEHDLEFLPSRGFKSVALRSAGLSVCCVSGDESKNPVFPSVSRMGRGI